MCTPGSCLACSKVRSWDTVFLHRRSIGTAMLSATLAEGDVMSEWTRARTEMSCSTLHLISLCLHLSYLARVVLGSLTDLSVHRMQTD